MGGWSSPSHWLIILLIVVLLFGAKKIPELAKGLGKGIKTFKDEMNNDDEVAKNTQKIEENKNTTNNTNADASIDETKKSLRFSLLKSIIFNEIKKILECDFALENPKDKNLAHFATPLAFSLAKGLKKSPMLIASDLASKFQNHDCFESVEAVNGYLNFRISKTFLNELANQALTNPNDFAKGEKKTRKFFA